MQTANNDKIIDFNNFKQQQTQTEESAAVAAVQFKPMLVWYPMWVMVPDQPPTPPNS